MGVVGSGVADMLTQNADCIHQAAGEDLKLKYVVDIREPKLPEGVILCRNIDDILADPDVTVIAETIGGVTFAYDYTKRALAAGKSVVTSNKELVATHGDELMRLAAENGVKYRYEAAVGGGIPVLGPIRENLAPNRISRVCGIVNGSTNYLITRMAETGVSFPVALGEAKKLGYVENNPAADVEGHDARRKLSILAHEAFGSPLNSDSLIPTMGITALTEQDITAARLFGGAVKLIAYARANGNTWSGWVHPAFVEGKSPLYGVCDVFNAVLVKGDFVDDVMFYGRGAGSHPTASAVVGDMLEVIAHKEVSAPRANGPEFADDPDALISAIIRVSEKQDLPGWEYREGDGVIAARTPLMPRSQIDQLPGVPLYVLSQD